MLMQLDFWHSYWEEYQPIQKEICQNGLDILSSGLLSHTIIPPGKLAELLGHVNILKSMDWP